VKTKPCRVRKSRRTALFPDHLEEGQEDRPLGRGEDAGTLPGERVVPLVADHLAVPEDPLVVEHQDVRLVGGVDPGGDRGQRTGQVDVVGVQEQDVVPAALLQPSVAGQSEADVLGQVQHPDPAVGRGVLVQDPAAAVRAGVVDADDLEVREGLAQHRIQARPQPGP
jgi:hypothetical protein